MIPKRLEKLIVSRIAPAFRNVIIAEHHGLCKGRSTVSNLATYTGDLAMALDSGLQVDAIYTDFSKAIDRVNHVILLAKLKTLGITGPLLRWMESYLTGRTPRVEIKGTCYNLLDAPKCRILTVTRRKAGVVYRYSINNEALDLMQSFRDLGVVIDRPLSFTKHYSCIMSRASKMLGYAKPIFPIPGPLPRLHRSVQAPPEIRLTYLVAEYAYACG